MDFSVMAGSNEKGDALVTITRSQTEKLDVVIDSPVRNMFKEQQDKAVDMALQNIDDRRISIKIEDNHALNFVLAARIKAAYFGLMEAEK